MKTLYSFLVVCFILFMMSSCDGCCRTGNPNDTITGSVVVDSPRVDGVDLSPNKLVVRFSENYPDSKKEQLKKDVWAIKDSIKKCSCGDSRIELWTIDTTQIKIEHAKSKTAQNVPGGGVNGDRQFYFRMPDPGSEPPSIGLDVDASDPVEPGGFQNILQVNIVAPDQFGSRVNIAMVDTGFDFKDRGFDSPSFLYDTHNLDMDCNSDYRPHISGWNFVDDNGDITDSHSDGHGTFVTKTLMRELKGSGVSYSILPIKAFDGKGKGSYWDVVCAFNYIKELQAKNGDLHIVNASFGYGLPVKMDGESYQKSVENYNEKSILKALIMQLDSLGTIVMASSGNDSLNTDEPEYAHFPSGFTAPNLIGIGGYIQTDYVKEPIVRTVKKITGNYGPISIDLASPYQMVSTEEIKNGFRTGTSYGTPVSSAKIAQFIDNGPGGDTPSQIISTFLTSPYVKTEPDFGKKVGMGRYIISDYQHIRTIPPILEQGGGTVIEP